MCFTCLWSLGSINAACALGYFNSTCTFGLAPGNHKLLSSNHIPVILDSLRSIF